MDTLYTIWENITHCKTKSAHFWGLMNSATKDCRVCACILGNAEAPVRRCAILPDTHLMFDVEGLKFRV